MYLMKYLLRFSKSVTVLLGLALVFYLFEVTGWDNFSQYFNVHDLKKLSTFAFYIIYTLLCFLVLPAATNKFIFKERQQEMGWVFPEKKIMALLLMTLALLLLVPFMIFFSKQGSFQGYSLDSVSVPKFVLMVAILFPLYYLAEEFFFRGFLFLGLWKRVGWHSFWITDIIFTLAHLGKPGFEVLLCIPASVVFNCLTLWTRSIFPAMVVHSTLGIVMSILVTFHFTVVG